MQSVNIASVPYADRVRLLKDSRSAACEKLVTARKQVEDAERVIAETSTALAMLEGLQDAPKEKNADQ